MKAECAPPTNGQCRDVKDNCFTYGKYACQAPYTAWAKDNCAYYCGFCGEFVGTTVPTTAASAVSSLGPHCASYCGFCGEFVGTPLCLLLRLLWRVRLDHCAYYCGFCGEFVVHYYWARVNCAYYCGFYDEFVVHCYWAKDNCACCCGFCGEFVGQLCLLLRLLR